MRATAITSVQNARVKDLVRLKDRRNRIEAGLFAVEGSREISRALDGGYECVQVFFCQNVMDDEASTLRDKLLRVFPKSQAFDVSPAVFAKIAIREGSCGLVVTYRIKERALDDLKLSSPGFLLLTEDVEKPGNLGAMLRTADGAGVDAVLALDKVADPFNPNVIRASLGAVFTTPVVSCSRGEALSYCQKHGFSLVIATPEAKKAWHELPGQGNVAVVVGSEANGVSEVFKNAPDAVKIGIPMAGKVDSLNVSVAAAIVMYEVRRQQQTVVKQS